MANHGLYIGYYTLWAMSDNVPIIVWENSPDLDETYSRPERR
jgi:hypothetical protein